MRRNVLFLILGNACGQSWPVRAVIYLYFLEVGATDGQYQMVQWAMFWTLLFIEIPTGYLSDRWSRKGTLIAGAVCRLFGISLYAVGWNVWWFLVGEQILAVAKSLHSGTVQSILRESLPAEDRAATYRRTAGLLDAVTHAFLLLSVFAGGIIGREVGLRATAILSACMSVVSLLLFLAVSEPIREKKTQERRRLVAELAQSFRQMFRSMRRVWREPTLWCLSTCFGILVAFSQHLHALRQPYARSIGLEGEVAFGLLEMSAMVVMIVAGILARSTHPKHDRLWFVVMGLVLFGGMTAGAGFSPGSSLLLVTALAIICLSRGVFAFGRPIVDDVIQKEHIDEERATILSIGTFFGYALVAVTGPCIQWMLETGWTVPAVLGIAGCSGACLYFLTLLRSSWFRLPRGAESANGEMSSNKTL